MTRRLEQQDKTARNLVRFSRALLVAVAAMTMANCVGSQIDEFELMASSAKNERSTQPLSIVVPPGWGHDAEAEQKLGAVAVLVPEGRTLQNAKESVLILFEKRVEKDARRGSLAEFFEANTLGMSQRHPGIKMLRWQPKLDRDRVAYISVALDPGANSDSDYKRIIFLQAADGFYTVALSADQEELLDDPKLEAMFSSLTLVGR